MVQNLRCLVCTHRHLLVYLQSFTHSLFFKNSLFLAAPDPFRGCSGTLLEERCQDDLPSGRQLVPVSNAAASHFIQPHTRLLQTSPRTQALDKRRWKLDLAPLSFGTPQLLNRSSALQENNRLGLPACAPQAVWTFRKVVAHTWG